MHSCLWADIPKIVPALIFESEEQLMLRDTRADAAAQNTCYNCLMRHFSTEGLEVLYEVVQINAVQCIG